MNLTGATVLVTGATGGIGEAIARTLAGRGSRLLLTGRNAEILEPLAAETGARAIVCDLAAREDLERLAGEAAEVDVLVANAAMQAGGDVLALDVAQIDRALDVNLRAPMLLARRLAEGMVTRGSGHILFVNSLSGKAASPGGAVYSATKFGLRGFALGLREDLRPHGIGVSTVFPGFVRDAGMFARSGARLPPFVGTITPQRVADAVVRTIESNRSERTVAPLSLRAGTLAASVAPEVAGRVQRLAGAAEIARQIAEGNPAEKRR
jgi:uncharacterized protein